MAIDLPAAKTALEDARRYSGQLIALIKKHEEGTIIDDIEIPVDEKTAIKAKAVTIRDDFQTAATEAISNLTT